MERRGRGDETGKKGVKEGGKEDTDCSRLGPRQLFLFQTLTINHISHRRHVPAANILIEGRRCPKHCASHKQAKPKCEKRESEHSGDCVDKGGDGKHLVVNVEVVVI